MFRLPDAQTQTEVSLLVIAGVVVGMFLVVRMVKRAAARTLALIVLAVLGLSVYVYRAELQQCTETCSCHIAGRDIRVAGCDLVRQ